MPVIQITVVQGRDPARIERCIREVARVVSETLHSPPDAVRVMVHEVPANRFAVGGRLKSDPTLSPEGGP